MTGPSIGPYRVIAKLGEGGMGEVYRARDTRLDRDVAVKILRGTFAGDPDRLRRFEREAKTLAALNHPNIAHIYGLEDLGGSYALVMELVEGPTLAERLEAEPTGLGLQDAVAIGRQIADAIETAHHAGVIHRDLKPANIKIRTDGTVKVLDFGLAKTAPLEGSTEISSSPTLTSPAGTVAGTLMGTPAYMSPEQARGLPVDTRTDIPGASFTAFVRRPNSRASTPHRMATPCTCRRPGAFPQSLDRAARAGRSAPAIR